MNEDEWEHLILQYLKNKGYSEAEKAFKQASKVTMGMQTEDEHMQRSLLENLFSYWAAKNDPKALVDMFSKLASWVENCLDMYKKELGRVMYPVFLHCYLELVANNATALASMLLTSYKRRLLDGYGGIAPRSRAQELTELGGIAVRQHLETNRFARALRTRKHVVRLSSYGHELLMHFLHNNHIIPLLDLVNRYITFEVAEGKPLDMEEEGGDDGGGGLATQADADVASINHQAVALGLPKDLLEDKLEELKRKEEAIASGAPLSTDAAAAEGPTGGEEAPGGPAAKKLKKDAKPVTKGKNEKDIRAARIEPEKYVPLLTERIQSAWMEDIKSRDAVQASHLPSCIFFTFHNTHQTLNCAAITRDAGIVAGGFSDASVRLYDVRSMGKAAQSSRGDGGSGDDEDGSEEEEEFGGRRRRVGMSLLIGHTDQVHSVDFSHDSSLIFSGSSDGTIRMWSTELGSVITSYRGHVLPVWNVSCCPRGLYFASASADRTARIWASDNLRVMRLLIGHQADVDVITWHPNCQYVATASSDRSIRLWDVGSGSCVRYMPCYHAAPTSLAVSPDGSTVVAGCEDGSLACWDLGSGKRLSLVTAGHNGPVWSLAFSHSPEGGAVLASGSADETVRLWSSSAAAHPRDPTAAVADAARARVVAADTGESAALRLLRTYRTKSTPVSALSFSARNLLMGCGAFNLRSKRLAGNSKAS